MRRLDFMYGRNGPRMGAGALLGRSARGRPIRVTAFGNWAERPKLLVVGCIHGDECEGRRVVERVIYGCPPADADVCAAGQPRPRRIGARHPPERPRCGPEPQLSGGMAAQRQPRRSRVLRAHDPSRSPRPAGRPPHHGAAAPRDDLVPPACRTRLRQGMGAERAGRRPLRARRRVPFRLHAVARGHRPELAEPPLPRHQLVRGRAAEGGQALRRPTGSPRRPWRSWPATGARTGWRCGDPGVRTARGWTIGRVV